MPILRVGWYAVMLAASYDHTWAEREAGAISGKGAGAALPKLTKNIFFSTFVSFGSVTSLAAQNT